MYLVHDHITTTIYKIAQADDVSVRRSSAASLGSNIVELFKWRTVQRFTVLVCKVAALCSENVPGTGVQLGFVRSA